MVRLVLLGGDCQIASEYAQAVARLRDVSFVAVVGQDERRRSEMAGILAAASNASSLDSLLEDSSDDWDAVLLHGPIGERVTNARRAARSGLHLLVAAPLASSVEEADQIIDTCQSAGVKLMVGSLPRFRPSIATIKQSLDRGSLGTPALLRIHAWRPRDDGHDGRSVHDSVANQLDLAQWMFQRIPTDIFALGRSEKSEASLGPKSWPDYVQIQLGFPHGGMALISVATSLPAGAGYDAISLIGSTGAAYSDDQYQSQLLFRGGLPSAPKTGEGLTAVTAQLREFAAAIAHNRDPAVGGMDGRISLLLAGAVIQSLATRQSVQLQRGQYEPIA